MRLGKIQTVPWDRYRHYAYNIAGPSYEEVRGSCGTLALAQITKLKPKHVARFLPKSNTCWTDRAIAEFLRRRGYKLIPVTIRNVTNLGRSNFGHIRRWHVLLASQHVTRTEGTWTVVWNHSYYHSGDAGPLNPLEFVNSPLWSLYVVWHPKWEKYKDRQLTVMEVELMMEDYERALDRHRRGFLRYNHALFDAGEERAKKGNPRADDQ